MKFPADRRYSKQHHWVRMEDGLATIGISEFAQFELGEVHSVSVATTGKHLLRNEVYGTIEAFNIDLPLNMPVTGTVAEFNPLLATTPSVVNKDPYGSGWIIKVKVSDDNELKELMQAWEYMGGW